MLGHIDTSLIDWSRAQFALTAIYHWIFVPLTLGLAVIMGIMETAYYRTGDEFWKRTAKFWMKIFGINFAIGVATGIILEFEFGTNWSNYSWFVGDIFGAPLAIEGILAFFMEATFIAVMFFGWDKVSKRFHLASTWLTGLGYPDGVHLAHRRPAAAGTGHSGRVHRQNLHGSQAPAPVCDRTGAGRFSGRRNTAGRPERLEITTAGTVRRDMIA